MRKEQKFIKDGAYLTKWKNLEKWQNFNKIDVKAKEGIEFLNELKSKLKPKEIEKLIIPRGFEIP